MERNGNGRLHVMVSVEGGLVASVQILRSETSAQRCWDLAIEEAKRRAGYKTLDPAQRKEFDQDPFGYAYAGEKDLIWEEASVED